MISFFEHLQTIATVTNVSQQTHQGSFSFVFSSMKSKESLSIVSRTFDLEIKLQEIMFFFTILKIFEVHLSGTRVETYKSNCVSGRPANKQSGSWFIFKCSLGTLSITKTRENEGIFPLEEDDLIYDPS